MVGGLRLVLPPGCPTGRHLRPRPGGGQRLPRGQPGQPAPAVRILSAGSAAAAAPADVLPGAGLPPGPLDAAGQQCPE
ncbi:hypothetical protein OF001_U10458 [Pseudomonas sp. OF001]|nr:hypothetical protein OF001_U10458 [Pseudomonas sp. OF001]